MDQIHWDSSERLMTHSSKSLVYLPNLICSTAVWHFTHAFIQHCSFDLPSTPHTFYWWVVLQLCFIIFSLPLGDYILALMEVYLKSRLLVTVTWVYSLFIYTLLAHHPSCLECLSLIVSCLVNLCPKNSLIVLGPNVQIHKGIRIVLHFHLHGSQISMMPV